MVEGYAGNIALKTAEGTARQMAAYVREALDQLARRPSSAPSWPGRPARAAGTAWTRGRLNGGPFLGLNGIVIKSHGGTDAFGFASAIGVGYDMAESDLLARLAADLEALHGKLGESKPPEVKQA